MRKVTKSRGKVNYPEHEKLKALQPQTKAVQAFIDWLFDEKGWTIANDDGKEHIRDSGLWPVRMSREEIMAAHFEIDLRKLDDEKRAMLDHHRELTGQV